jgi:hypothetical protein
MRVRHLIALIWIILNILRDDVHESLTYSSELYVSKGLIWKNSRDMQEYKNKYFLLKIFL